MSYNKKKGGIVLRRIYVYIIVILIVIIGFSLFTNMTVAKKYDYLKIMYLQQKQELEVYKELVKYKDIISDSDYALLTKSGLKNPIEDIKTDLLSRKDIIKHDGIKGGIMGFYDSRNIYILNNKWVYAVYEDGHIAGSMLLEYKVKNGKISWNIIKEML